MAEKEACSKNPGTGNHVWGGHHHGSFPANLYRCNLCDVEGYFDPEISKIVVGKAPKDDPARKASIGAKPA